MTTATSTPEYCPLAYFGKHRIAETTSYIFGQWITTIACRDCHKVFQTTTEVPPPRAAGDDR